MSDAFQRGPQHGPPGQQRRLGEAVAALDLPAAPPHQHLAQRLPLGPLTAGHPPHQPLGRLLLPLLQVQPRPLEQLEIGLDLPAMLPSKSQVGWPASRMVQAGRALKQTSSVPKRTFRRLSGKARAEPNGLELSMPTPSAGTPCITVPSTLAPPLFPTRYP